MQRDDAVALLLIAAAVTFVFAGVLFLGQSLVDRDLPVYSFPTSKIVRDLVLAGEMPYWNRLTHSGQPLAANPAFEVFYPPRILLLLPSFTLGFKLHIVLHFYLAAFGMFALGRALGFSRAASVFASIAFALGGPMMSFGALLPFLFVTSWMPWVFFFGVRRRFVGTAIALAMQVLIGEPIVFASTCALLLFGSILIRELPRAFAAVAMALALGAVQLIPAIDHAGDSARSVKLPWEEVKAWSMAPERPVELFAAGFRREERSRFAPFILSIYLGFAVAALAVAGLVLRRRLWWAVVVVLGVSYALAIGEHTRFLRWLYDLGLFSSLRFPEKLFIPALFVLVVFAASVFDALADLLRRVRIPAAVVVVLAAIDVIAVSYPLLLRQPDRFYDPPALLAQLPMQTRVFHEAAQERSQLGRWPPNLTPETRVWMMRNDLHPFLPAAWGRPTAMDYDFDLTTLYNTRLFEAARTLAEHDRHPSWPRLFMAMSAAPLRILPSDAPPPRVGEDRPTVQIRRELESAPRYYFASSVVACRDFQDCMVKMNQRSDAFRLALVPSGKFAIGQGRVLRAFESANEATIDVVAEDPAFLVMSVTHHKYWKATIDGKEAEIVPVNFAYQGLPVPAGAHRVHVVYRNPLIAIGAMVSAAAAALLIAIGSARRRWRRTSPPEPSHPDSG